MLLEALEYATTRAPPWARKLGYLKEAIALRHRARRCRGAWAPHQDRTKAALLELTPLQNERITVLGAGLCLDVPVAALAARCEQLVLIDAVRLRGLSLPPNARYVEDDIDGTAKALAAGDEAPAPLSWADAPGIVLSVNVLSQLPVLPERFRRARMSLSENAREQQAKEITDRHIQALEAHGNAVLICDTERRVYDLSNSTVETQDLSADYALPEPLQSWTWHVIPKGEIHSKIRVENTVGVWGFQGNPG